MSRAIAYLNKHRGIDYEIIKWLIRNKLLYQEKMTNNIIFPMYDKTGEIVGADLHGTLTDEKFKFKKIAAGSKYGYGYNINPSQSETIKFMLFFESSIDLLSFWNIKRTENKNLEDCLLISMAGLKENIIDHFLNAFKSPLTTVLCVDNDEAGVNFTKAVLERLEGVRTLTPQSRYKDWNEQLQSLRYLK
jgi:DNA primase